MDQQPPQDDDIYLAGGSPGHQLLLLRRMKARLRSEIRVLQALLLALGLGEIALLLLLAWVLCGGG